MTNSVMAIFAFLLLTVFLCILFFSVPHLDLILVCLLAIAMCGYDFYLSVKTDEKH
jgi:hypothetical protein